MKAVFVVCKFCHTKYVLQLPEEGLEKWMAGEHVQNAFPKLSADERELLISGVCGACYDETCLAAEE